MVPRVHRNNQNKKEISDSIITKDFPFLGEQKRKIGTNLSDKVETNAKNKTSENKELKEKCIIG